MPRVALGETSYFLLSFDSGAIHDEIIVLSGWYYQLLTRSDGMPETVYFLNYNRISANFLTSLGELRLFLGSK